MCHSKSENRCFFSHDTSLNLHPPLYMCIHNYTGVLDSNNGENLKLFIDERCEEDNGPESMDDCTGLSAVFIVIKFVLSLY